MNISHTSGNWEGLDNAAWGSHVYYSTVVQYIKIRIAKGDTFSDKPLTLTKFGLPDWRPGMGPVMHQESPAMHRFPVWWTGDGVPLLGSVGSMVDSGVHDLKIYVHSDCAVAIIMGPVATSCVGPHTARSAPSFVTMAATTGPGNTATKSPTPSAVT